MKVAILSESQADEAAVRILLEACLGEAVEPLPRPQRLHGWNAVFRVLPGLIRGLHFRRRAEHVVVVLDSNRSPVHEGPVDGPCENPDTCRLCMVRRNIDRVMTELSPVPSQEPIRIAVGLAVPAIEAWYLCGKNPNVSENAWVVGMRENRLPYTKAQLKQEAYGTDRPSLALETERATEEMRRVAENLGLLERKFPQGFGALRSDLRRWRGSG